MARAQADSAFCWKRSSADVDVPALAHVGRPQPDAGPLAAELLAADLLDGDRQLVERAGAEEPVAQREQHAAALEQVAGAPRLLVGQPAQHALGDLGGAGGGEVGEALQLVLAPLPRQLVDRAERADGAPEVVGDRPPGVRHHAEVGDGEVVGHPPVRAGVGHHERALVGHDVLAERVRQRRLARRLPRLGEALRPRGRPGGRPRPATPGRPARRACAAPSARSGRTTGRRTRPVPARRLPGVSSGRARRRRLQGRSLGDAARTGQPFESGPATRHAPGRLPVVATDRPAGVPLGRLAEHLALVGLLVCHPLDLEGGRARRAAQHVGGRGRAALGLGEGLPVAAEELAVRLGERGQQRLGGGEELVGRDVVERPRGRRGVGGAQVGDVAEDGRPSSLQLRGEVLVALPAPRRGARAAARASGSEPALACGRRPCSTTQRYWRRGSVSATCPFRRRRTSSSAAPNDTLRSDGSRPAHASAGRSTAAANRCSSAPGSPPRGGTVTTRIRSAGTAVPQTSITRSRS